MRFQSVDALRGLAALAVLGYHLWSRFFPGATTQNPHFLVPHGPGGHLAFFLFGFGYLGVNLFFVVSGFCIHLPQALKFHATASDRLSLRTFARRRFFRLYPAYFASLVWTSLVLIALPLLAHFVRHTPFHLAHAADLPNFCINALFLQQTYPRADEFNGVYWTLVYEVQFYLFYPLLLWCCRRCSFAVMLLALLAAELFFLRVPSPIHNLFLERYFEWFLGMALAERVAQRKPLPVPAAVLPILFALGLASLFQPAAWPLHNLLTSVAFTALLAWCLQHEPQHRWLGNARLVALGVFSYSLYLVHVPVIDLCWNTVRLARTYAAGLPFSLVFLCVPLSLALGYVFYLCFERPFLGKISPKTPALATGTTERAW